MKKLIVLLSFFASFTVFAQKSGSTLLELQVKQLQSANLVGTGQRTTITDANGNIIPVAAGTTGHVWTQTVSGPQWQPAGGGSMVYPSAGIAVSDGSGWITSITNNSTDWNTAFTDRFKWDGGSTGLVPATGRASLGATTVGENLFTLSNPNAVRFIKINTNNSISLEDAATHRSSMGAGIVNSVAITSANGITGSSSGGAGPSLTISLGAITPTSVAASGTVTGSNISGTNTGDQFTNVTASRLLGRYAATAGAAQEISIGAGISLDNSTGVLTASNVYNTNGTLTTDRTIDGNGNDFIVMNAPSWEIGGGGVDNYNGVTGGSNFAQLYSSHNTATTSATLDVVTNTTNGIITLQALGDAVGEVSSIVVDDQKITITPEAGDLRIADLANVSASYVLNYDPTTDIVSYAAASVDENSIKLYQALGGTIKAETPWKIDRATSSQSMVDGTVRFTPVYLEKSATLNGVIVYQGTAGSYTADNYNGIGLYTISGGTLTLVASSTDNGSLWTSGNTLKTVAFSSSYAAQPGAYYIGVLYNSSAQTTAPQLLCAAGIASQIVGLNFTNSYKLSMTLASQNTLPSSVNASSCTASGTLLPALVY